MKYVVMLLLLVFPLLVQAEEGQLRLAVLEFTGEEVDQNGRLLLSDQARTGAVNIVDTNRIIVMTRENMEELLKDNGQDLSCLEGKCEVETARNIGADYVISGWVTIVEGEYILTLKLHNVQNGALKASQVVKDASLRDLGSKARSATEELLSKQSFGKGFTEGGSSGGTEWMPPSNDKVVVSFTSSPTGASVLVDGNLICETPCKKAVSAGSRRIEYQKVSHHPWKDIRVVKQGTEVKGELKPTFGFLELSSSQDGVEVFLTDLNVASSKKSLGMTPVQKKQLDAGLYQWNTNDPCFESQQYRFQIKEGENKKIEIPMEHREAGIEINLQDKEGNDLIGKIKVDGKNYGTTPSTIKVPLCSDKLEVSANGRKVRKSLSLKEREVKKYDLVLTNRDKKLVAKKYTRVSQGLLVASGVMFGSTVWTYQSYLSTPDATQAENLYQLNNVSHTTALSLVGLSGVTYLVGKVAAQ